MKEAPSIFLSRHKCDKRGPKLWGVCTFSRLGFVRFVYISQQQKYLPISVTRLLDYLFNIWAFTTLIICPKAHKICQSKLKMFPNTKLTLSKRPKFFNAVPKWGNFSKSGHTALQFHATNYFPVQNVKLKHSFDNNLP